MPSGPIVAARTRGTQHKSRNLHALPAGIDRPRMGRDGRRRYKCKSCTQAPPPEIRRARTRGQHGGEGRNAVASPSLVFVGTYTEPIRFGTGQILQGGGRGIYCLRLDPASGELTQCGLTEGVRNPSYLAFDRERRFLYAVNELKEFAGEPGGAVSAFAIDRATGALRLINKVASQGGDPCHLMVTPQGGHVLAANFMTGHVTVLPIRPDGGLLPARQVILHAGSSIDPVRQTGPHAHAVAMDAAGRFVFVPDLGLDQVVVYRFDAAAGRLLPAEPPFVAAAPGAGPRQLVMHPDGRHAYLVNELNCTMTAFDYDAASGRLTELQTLPTLPEDFTGRNICAEVQVSPDGRFLYGSNRGHDSLVAYAIEKVSGRLSLLGHTSTGGEIPRNFDISPDGRWLAVANQDTGDVVMFRRDQASGALTRVGTPVAVPTPVCVRFL